MKKGNKKWLFAVIAAAVAVAEVIVPGPVTALAGQLAEVVLGDPVHEVKP